MKKVSLIILTTLIVFFIYFNFFYIKQKMVLISEKEFTLYIAGNDFLRGKGLSGRNFLPENSGMFFAFEKPDIYGFWMKDMNFPIDIVWLDENCAITTIKENATPESYPEIFSPEKPSKYALEINSFEGEKLGLKIGQNYDFCR